MKDKQGSAFITTKKGFCYLTLNDYRLEAGRFKGGLEVLDRVPAKGRYKRA